MTQIQSQSSESQHNVAERKKSNLAFAFFCMDKDRAKDMEIYYAFCRLMDDIADEEVKPVQERKNELLKWKDEIRKIYVGDVENLTPLAVEMKGVIERRNIPQQYLQELIDGVLTDTAPKPFETFEQVKQYCYGVASAVGLASIYIFGFKNERTKLFAEALGYALQFTNILRDVVDDITSHDRVYIPSEELEAFGVSREDLFEPNRNPNCKKLFQFMYFRAKHFFNQARRLIAEEDRLALTPAFIMWRIYEKILDSLKERNFDITTKPLKISKLQKIRLALSAIYDSKKKHKQNNFFGKATVIGTGISGITMATRLLWEGFDVEMFEARNTLGGRISKISSFGTELDNAQHVAMGCYDNFFNAIKQLGNNPNDYFKKVDGMDFIYTDKSVVPIKYPNGFVKKAFSALSYAKLKDFSNPRNIALLLSIKVGLLPDKDESAENFLKRKKIPAKTIESFWAPFCVSALNTSIANASARLVASTLRKSILKGFASAILYIPIKPIESAFEIFKIYMKGCGSKIFFSESVKKINFENNFAVSINTTKADYKTKYVFSAVGSSVLQQLLPQESNVAKKIAKIKQASIVNIYFTTPQKLIENDYACLVGSQLHWIFNHTDKLPQSENKLYLYSITLSNCSQQMSKEQAKILLDAELKKLFGSVDIDDVLPSCFATATISADSQTESSRPEQAEILKEYPNLFVVGDFIQCDLPCTMESAAKSAFEISLER